MPLESPSSHRTLTPVGPGRSYDQHGEEREGREVLDVHKASATNLSVNPNRPTVVDSYLNACSNEM